ncbi:MAG: hypothetical protein RMK57_06585 [Bryobacterales bacterium]|nr:hypothetical protein [Bryobacteraceae bacterium]MDW8354181.1 hypothetical protein [Bryobacterales bacterium]
MAFLMSDRGWLFLLSVIIVLASLGVAGWLVLTDQALSFDGLMLLLTCLILAFAFGLYAGYLLRQAMKELESAAPAGAQSVAQTTPKPAAPVSARPAPATGNPGRHDKPAEAGGG